MKYFKLSEFDCKETGENEMDPNFLWRLDLLREYCRFPFIVNSGYRSVTHSKETWKRRPGNHTKGIAADIRVKNGVERRLIVLRALTLGFNGIGVYEHFVHIDDRKTRAVLWGDTV